MIITRRSLLGTAALTLAVPALAGTMTFPVRTLLRGPGSRDYGAAVEAIRTCAQAELAATGLPGMIVSLVGDDGFEAELCLGWADLASREPVGPDHLFEIGSISKSLTAFALWQLAAEGKIDLDAPVSRYLPLDCLPPEPITAQQLLNHVAGLADGAPIPPNVPGGRLWTGAKPGTHFSYSNTGYELLGLLITTIAGRPHPEIIRERVQKPIGMARATAHIRLEDRARMASGYITADDLPPMFGCPLQEGSWNEMDDAAGSVMATAADMAAYLRYVIALGRGHGAPLLPDATATALLAAVAKAEKVGGGYSSGFMRTKLDGRPMLHHTGGMQLFTSSFDADPEGGFGAFASTNGTLGNHRPTLVTAYAMRVLRAVREGKPLPAQPDPYASRRIEKPDHYVGRWIAADGTILEVRGQGRDLILLAGSRSGRLELVDGQICTDLPGYRSAPLEFSSGSKSGDKNAAPDRLWYRDVAFGREKAPDPAKSTPQPLLAFTGDYRSPNPWFGGADIVARGDTLVALGTGVLVRDTSGFWRAEEDKGGYERFWFDVPVAGRMHRLILSGAELTRLS
jgi:CubicO group peptidase (beta-lactamase class C family)